MSEQPTPTVTHRAAIGCTSDVHGAVMLAYNAMMKAHASAVLATETATVVSELAMNVVKYAASGGHVRITLGRAIRQAKGRVTASKGDAAEDYVEVSVEDAGPGIEDIARAMQDHFSSSGTLGVGLPGVKRMVDEFDIESTPGVLTRVRTRKWLPPSKQNGNAPDRNVDFSKLPEGGLAGSRLGRERWERWERSVVASVPAPSKGLSLPLHPLGDAGPASQTSLQNYGTVNRPCFGEAVSGDRCFMFRYGDGILLGIVDVLGHGAEAHALALRCDQWLAQATQQVKGSLEELLIALHGDIRGSRGAAVSLAWVRQRQVSVVGVGNTIVYVLQNKVTPVCAQPGIVGSHMPRLRPVALDLNDGEVLLLTTDGISERMDSSRLLAIRHHPPQRIAREVLREYGKPHDDASCAVFLHQRQADTASGVADASAMDLQGSSHAR